MKCWAECNLCRHLWLTTIGDDLDCPMCGEEIQTEHRFDIPADCKICVCGSPIDPSDEDCVEMANCWICGDCLRYWDACDTEAAASVGDCDDYDHDC